MKIGPSLDNYSLNNRLPRTEIPVLSLDLGEQDGKPPSEPSVAVGNAAAPSSFSNALWLVRAEQPADVYLDPAKATAAERSHELNHQFSEWSDMTPAEKIRAAILEARGLTEESFRSLDPDAQEAIIEEIKQAIKEQLGLGEAKETTEATGSVTL